MTFSNFFLAFIQFIFVLLHQIIKFKRRKRQATLNTNIAVKIDKPSRNSLHAGYYPIVRRIQHRR